MKDYYFQIYRITESIIGKFIRIVVFLTAILLVLVKFQDGADLKLYVAIFALILINELFLEHLKRIKPEKEVDARTDNFEKSMVFSARSKFVSHKSSFDVAKSLSVNPAVKFFMAETGIDKVEKADIPRDEFLKQAYEIVVYVHGRFITDVDLFAACILLTEEATHFMQNNKFDNDDIMNIVYWTRNQYRPAEFESQKIRLLGEGVFDSLCYGWNVELKKYAKDLSWEVMNKSDIPTITGAEKSFKELEVALSKQAASNVIIVGEPGTGKTALVNFLAYSSFLGKTNRELSHKRIYELFVDRLISGVANAGDLETRLSSLLADIAHSGNSIVFIQNIEGLFGGGGFGFDISGVLSEYLTSDKIKMIGTTTSGGYANYIQGKASVSDLFEKVQIEEFDRGKSLLLLTDLAGGIANKYRVRITYHALKQAVVLANTYFPDRFLPGGAVELLASAASKAKIDKKRVLGGDDITNLVQSKTNVVLAEPDVNEKELLLHLEDKLHARVIGQDEAINAMAASLRRLRSGFSQGEKPISVFLFLGPTGVGKTETAKALAREYFGSENRMLRLDMSEYQTQDQIDRILGSKSGQAYTPNTLTETISKNPFSLVLLDEFEKAHPQLLNLFLQVFDEGRLTDNSGKTVSFKNTIIIATSNAGAEVVREKEAAGQKITKEELTNYLMQNNLFKPELLNRFDDIIMFKFLDAEEVKKIAGILLTEQLGKLSEKQIKITFDDAVLSKIAKESYKPEFGAREIRRYIENNVEEFLSKKILSGEIPDGSSKALSVDESGNLVIR